MDDVHDVQPSKSLMDALNEANSKTEATEGPSTHSHAEDLAPVPPPIGSEKKMSFSQKHHLKKMKKAQEARNSRVAELRTRGLNDEQIGMQIAKEEYESEPIHLKLMRLESMVTQGMQNLASEMVNLRHNDEILADAMDVNFRAMSKALVEAGIPLEKQKEIMELVEKEMTAAREAQQKKFQAARESAQKATDEKQKLDELTADIDKEGSAAAPPEATSFGG